MIKRGHCIYVGQYSLVVINSGLTECKIFSAVEGLELGAFHDRDEQINDAYTREIVLSGLLPNTKYRVHIFARTMYGRGEGVFVEATTTDKICKKSLFNFIHELLRKPILLANLVQRLMMIKLRPTTECRLVIGQFQ